MLIDLPPASLIIIIVFQHTKSSDSFILPIITVRSSLDKSAFSIANPRLVPRLRISKILFELIFEFYLFYLFHFILFLFFIYLISYIFCLSFSIRNQSSQN